jgi:hypothetical protein
MRDIHLRFGVSADILCDVSFNPRFSRHSKCLLNKAILSGVQNFVIAIGKPIQVKKYGDIPRHEVSVKNGHLI